MIDVCVCVCVFRIYNSIYSIVFDSIRFIIKLTAFYCYATFASFQNMDRGSRHIYELRSIR